jgi:2-polyprenyl-6-methoxyphenol hydroxylase-like FAD-dependent oxidoreductase
MMLGPDTPDKIVWLGGMYYGYFTIPRPIKEGEQFLATTYMAPPKRFILMRRHRADRVQVYLGCRTTSDRLVNVRRGDVKAEIDAFVDIFRGAGWQTDQILKSLQEETDDFYCERIGVVKLESWSRGRVVLLGDAAYCPSANTGMGTTSAVVGAYILAGEIAKQCGNATQNDDDAGNHTTKDNLFTALKLYDQKFHPFMDQVQRGLTEGSVVWDWIAASQFSVFIFNCFIALASFFRLNILGRFALREDVGDWKLPDYKEIVQA